MSLLPRIGRRLRRGLVEEPGRRLDASLLLAQILVTGLDLPGLPRRGRRGLGQLARALGGQAARRQTGAPPTSREGVSAMDGLPIVFMHRGNSDYLRYTLAQARRSNPLSPIYLLGDASNNCYEDILHRPFRDYYERAAELDRTFRHFSTNGVDYTRFDFQRWLILDEFMRAHSYAEALYLDSDVLLFTNVTRDRLKFADYDIAIAHLTGSVFFANQLDALRELGDFILNIYRRADRYHYERMVAHFVTRRRSGLPGGACDMMALSYFRDEHYGRVGDVAAIVDDAVYDLALGVAQGFLMSDGVKSLVWDAGVPYGTLARSGRRIRFSSLHFQGRVGKPLIPQAFERASVAYGIGADNKRSNLAL